MAKVISLWLWGLPSWVKINLLIIFQGKGQRLNYYFTFVVGPKCLHFRCVACARNFGIWLYQKRIWKVQEYHKQSWGSLVLCFVVVKGGCGRVWEGRGWWMIEESCFSVWCMQHIPPTPLNTASRLGLGPSQPYIHWIWGAFFSGVKWPGHDADHTPTSSARLLLTHSLPKSTIVDLIIHA
jgi:hypothetical protein